MIKITEFENGFRIGTDIMKDVETVTVCVAIGIGSRFEDKPQSGISHFLEHMAFKGTKKRTALEIVKEIEMVGGYMNAYTSRERTVYYIKVLKNDLSLAVDILSDILQHSSFISEEIERERGVILQELASGEDTPDDVVFDYYYETLFQNQSIGRPIIGNRETIRSFQKIDFENYIKSKYNAGNMVLSAAGNINHEEVCELASKFFTDLEDKNNISANRCVYNGGEFIKKNSELTQTQFVLGYNGVGIFDDSIYSMKIANNILGGGMSSRLFQEVREKRGLVYTISSFETSFSDGGIFGIYAGTAPESLNELDKVVEAELNKITQEVQDEEMEKTISQIKAGLLMSQESTTSRAQKLASNILTHGRYIPNEELISKFQAVSKEDVKNTVKSAISSKQTRVIYGNV